MKKIITIALFVASSSAAFGSEIKLVGEAGESVCSLLRTLSNRETYNPKVDYEDRLAYVDTDNIVRFSGGAVRCYKNEAIIRGHVRDVEK